MSTAASEGYRNVKGELAPTHSAPTYANKDLHGAALRRFCEESLFGQPNTLAIVNNPYRRAIRPQDVAGLNFLDERITPDSFASPEALCAQRLLATIYEQDTVLLPMAEFDKARYDFDRFYRDDLKVAGEILRPTLERFCFAWLDDEIKVAGPWTIESMRAYFDARLAQANAGDSAVCRTILSSAYPQAAARELLVQMASDFLLEASAMGRNVLGNYGPALSSLFRIFIDEYGYGVHATKHSTLFERTLESIGLDSSVNAYWPFYLGSSLALVTWFHYVSRNHGLFFRYLGALLFTEGTLYVANRQQSDMLRAVFGDKVDTQYFDEHVHIDVHHSRMAMTEVIETLVRQCGTSIIPEIVHGFEAFAMLQKMADDDFIEQIEWASKLNSSGASAGDLDVIPADAVASFEEPPGEISVPHSHPVDELFVVKQGALTFIAGSQFQIPVSAGEWVRIPKHRLHGSIVTSEQCRYATIPVR